MSEKEIREFMKKYYPQYADNIELGKILYERFIKKKKRSASRTYTEPEYKKIKDLKSGERVKVKGIVADVTKHSYEGCAVCKRRNCKNPEHKMEGTKTWYVTGFVIGDETGTIYASRINDKYLAVDDGDEVEITGYVKEYKGKLEMVIYDGKILKKAVKPEMEESQEEEEENEIQKELEEEMKKGKKPKSSINWDEIDDELVKKLLKAIEASGKIKKDIVEEAARKRGIDMEKVKQYVKIKRENGVEYYVLR